MSFLSNTWGRLGALLLLLLLFAHWVACTWWFIGLATLQEDTDFEPHSLETRSWIERVQLDQTESLSDMYMASLYWALTTLIKTPSVGPGPVGEKVYASLMVLMGGLVFAIILGQVTSIVRTLDATNAT